MFNKIKICLCHPKYIGVYFKDNLWKPLLSVFIGFVIMFFVLGILCSNTTFFEHSDVKSITNTLYYQEECDSIYDSNTKKMTGSSKLYKGEDFIVGFFQDKVEIDLYNYYINFSEKYIDLYVYGVKIGKIEYEKVIDKSFSMSNVQKGKLTDTFIFEEMIENVFLEVEGNQKIVSFFSNAISIVIYYLVVLVTVFIFSYYVNPSIEGKIRIRLCLYDTLIFFVIVSLSFMFRAMWLQYISMIVPAIFSFITFSHIIKIEKKV